MIITFCSVILILFDKEATLYPYVILVHIIKGYSMSSQSKQGDIYMIVFDVYEVLCVGL